MKVLRKQSHITAALNEAFRADLERYFFLSFFETTSMPIIGQLVRLIVTWSLNLASNTARRLINLIIQVVSKESATLGLSVQREKQLPLHANHSQMCKFSSISDSDYVLVSSNIEDFARGALLLEQFPSNVDLSK
jgi:hypothetical protein